MVIAKSKGGTRVAPAFNAQAFLDSAGLSKKIVLVPR
jgi:hypothetical protein